MPNVTVRKKSGANKLNVRIYHRFVAIDFDANNTFSVHMICSAIHHHDPYNAMEWNAVITCLSPTEKGLSIKALGERMQVVHAALTLS